MSVNNAIFHRTIGHHLRVQRYSLGANDEFNQILAEAYDQIRQVVADNSAVIDSQNTDSSEYAAMLAAIFTIWEDTKPALQDAMETALQEFAANEVENEIATLQDEIPADVTLQVPSEEEIANIVADAAFQGRTLDTWLEDFKAADLSRIKAVIVGGMQAGENAGSIAGELTAGTFQTGFNMLGNIVRTVWNGITNWARLLVLGANKDIVPQVIWMAVLDDATSFPAGTPVATPAGHVPIERLHVGDLVDTPIGPQPILAINIYQARGLVRLNAGGSIFRATPDHKFMRLRDGAVEWTAACCLQPGDQLCKIASDQALSAETFYVTFSPADHTPSIGVKKGGLPSVLLLVSVPVCSVDFEGDPVLWEQDIDTVAPDLILLQERDAGGIQRLADPDFQPIGTPVSSVTGQITKNTVGSWNNAELFATMLAGADEGRSSAFLATEFQSPASAVEQGPATGAWNDPGLSRRARSGADVVSVGITPRDGESNAALGTSLGDTGVGSITCYATIRSRHLANTTESTAAVPTNGIPRLWPRDSKW